MRGQKKVQVNFSLDYDIYTTLTKECSREATPLSQYMQWAINKLGPLTFEMAQEIRMNSGSGQQRDKFFDARPPQDEHTGI